MGRKDTKLKIKVKKPRNPLVVVVMTKGVRKHKDKRKQKLDKYWESSYD